MSCTLAQHIVQSFPVDQFPQLHQLLGIVDKSLIKHVDPALLARPVRHAYFMPCFCERGIFLAAQPCISIGDEDGRELLVTHRDLRYVPRQKGIGGFRWTLKHRARKSVRRPQRMLMPQKTTTRARSWRTLSKTHHAEQKLCTIEGLFWKHIR